MLLEVNRERKPVNCPGGVFFVARLRVVSIHEVPRRVVFPETKLPVELSEKALEPPFLAPRAAKQSFFGLFRRLLRLQFGAFRGFRTVSLGRWVNRGNSPPTPSFVGWQAVGSSAKLVPYGIACAHSSGHISGRVGNLSPSSNRDCLRRRVGVLLLFLTNLFLSPPIPISIITVLICAIGGVVGWLIIVVLYLLQIAFYVPAIAHFA